MKRFVMLMAALALCATTLTACRLTGRLPYYRESNKPLSADSKPYEVRRGPIDIHALTDLKPLEQKGMFRKPIGYVSGLATNWLPEDVAEKNRKKFQGFTGKSFKDRDLWDPAKDDPFPEVEVILALSGGGARASNLSSAVMFYLSQIQVETAEGRPVTLLETVDVISSVSGGGFAAIFGIYHREVFRGNTDPKRAERNEDLLQVAMRENIQARLLRALILPTKVSWWIRGATRATRSNLYSNLLEYRMVRPQRIETLESMIYPSWWRKSKLISGFNSFLMDIFWILTPLTPDDQYLFGNGGRKYDDLYLRDPDEPHVLYPLRPEWLANATSFNKSVEDNAFIFEEEAFNGMRSDWMKYRISDAVAASASFPVMFTPMVLRDWSGEDPEWIFLFDGGVSDNQGMNGVRRVLGRKPPSRKAVVIMVDASPRSGAKKSDNADRPGGLAITNRAIAGYMNSVRRQSIEGLQSREREGNLRFFHLSIRPEEFGSPLSEEKKAAFESANEVPTALKISRKRQETLFEVGKILVDRDRDAMREAVGGSGNEGADPPAPAPPEGVAPPP
jgi:hypothetical protein